MAVGTHFKLQVAARRAGAKAVATAASHSDVFVVRMDAGFHDSVGRGPVPENGGAQCSRDLLDPQAKLGLWSKERFGVRYLA